LHELRFVIDEKKPFFLVKMCDRFAVDETRFRLTSNVCHAPWPRGTPMPADFVPQITARLRLLGAGGAAADRTATQC